MPPWQQDVLARFDTQVLHAVPLTVVEDRDQVVASEQIATELRRRGADLITYRDPVAIRHLIESKYRGQPDAPHVVVRTDDLRTIPWDLSAAADRQGQCVSISLAELFPRLDAEVLPHLDRMHLDVLSEALISYTPALGRQGTVGFILEHVFGIVPSALTDRPSLLSTLIELHYADETLPEPVAQQLTDLLTARRAFATWPVGDLVRSSSALWSFIQSGWDPFLRRVLAIPAEDPGEEGPELPLDDPRVRIRIDNLFLEGYLKPTDQIDAHAVEAAGFGFGVVSEDRGDYEILAELTEHASGIVPDVDADHNEWRRFARTWGEWRAAEVRVHSLTESQLATTVVELETRVQTTFETWMRQRYAGMVSLPYLPTPPMLHHVPDYVSHGRVEGQTVTKKVAVLVLDGMGFAQWHEIRPYLDALDAQVDEHAVFAWVPTLTVVSRQAIFAGEPPYSYAQSIDTTRKESTHWRRYWTSRGIRDRSIQFVPARKHVEQDSIVADFQAAIDHPTSRIIGGVILTIDEFVHNSPTGAGNLRVQLIDWLERGFLQRIVAAFLDADYDLFITSDHGNVEVRGIGRPNLGSIPDEQGQRAGRFGSAALRKSSLEGLDGVIEWDSPSLPPDYFPVLAPWDGAFVPRGQVLVGHGGITLDETIVPFVSVTRA